MKIMAFLEIFIGKENVVDVFWYAGSNHPTAGATTYSFAVRSPAVV